MQGVRVKQGVIYLKVKSKIILALLKLLGICFSYVIPFIFGLLIIYNIVLNLTFGIKLYFLELSVLCFLSFVFAFCISLIIHVYERQLFIAFCNVKDLEPSTSNYKWWHLQKWQNYNSMEMTFFEKKMERI